jgi:hypothetical protein
MKAYVTREYGAVAVAGKRPNVVECSLSAHVGHIGLIASGRAVLTEKRQEER